MRIGIDPGSSSPGAAAWGHDEIEGVIVWTWGARAVQVRSATTGDALASEHPRRGRAEQVIARQIAAPDCAVLALERPYQPQGAYGRRRSSVGSVLPLAEHCGALLAALLPRLAVGAEVWRPLATEWRPMVGIPARTAAAPAGGLAIEIAASRGWRFAGSVAAQEAAAEACLIWLAAGLRP